MGIGSLLAVMAIWGLNFSVIKLGLEGVPALLLSSLRFLFAALPAVFFVPRPKCHWKWVVAFGVASGIFQFSFLFFGIDIGMSAGLASVVLQAHVFFTLILGAILLKERMGAFAIGGTALAAIGLVLIGSIQNTDTNVAAVALVILAALSWAVANIITRKAAPVNMFSFIVWSSLVPILPLFALSTAIDGWTAIEASIAGADMTSALSVLYLAYATTVLGYGIWSAEIGRHGVSLVVPFTLSVPIFGILGSHLIFGEELGPIEITAVALILTGLFITIMGPRLFRPARATPAPTPKP